MKREYIPTACRKKDSTIKGSVTLRMPTFNEKYGYIEQCGFSLDENGQVKAGMEQLGAIRKMVDLTKSHYEDVNLKAKDGTEFKSFDDMQYDSRCDPILIEVAAQIMGGLAAGKS